MHARVLKKTREKSARNPAKHLEFHFVETPVDKAVAKLDKRPL
jgi:hypothetical protein